MVYIYSICQIWSLYDSVHLYLLHNWLEGFGREGGRRPLTASTWKTICQSITRLGNNNFFNTSYYEKKGGNFEDFFLVFRLLLELNAFYNFVINKSNCKTNVSRLFKFNIKLRSHTIINSRIACISNS